MAVPTATAPANVQVNIHLLIDAGMDSILSADCLLCTGILCLFGTTVVTDKFERKCIGPSRIVSKFKHRNYGERNYHAGMGAPATVVRCISRRRGSS